MTNDLATGLYYYNLACIACEILDRITAIY